MSILKVLSNHAKTDKILLPAFDKVVAATGRFAPISVSSAWSSGLMPNYLRSSIALL
jgi:hypothetical protein